MKGVDIYISAPFLLKSLTRITGFIKALAEIRNKKDKIIVSFSFLFFTAKMPQLLY